MIALGRLDHVALRVADVGEASGRWAAQFGLRVTDRDADRAMLVCDDEPRALELLAGDGPGFARVGWELAHDCSLDDAAGHLDGLGISFARAGEAALDLADLEGNALRVVAHHPPASRLVAHARPAPPGLVVGHPRRLGHVNFLTTRIAEQRRFYEDVLGMRLTDWLGDGGVWLHIGSEHHVMALVQTENPPPHSHFHHLALDVVDIGQMQDTLDHLGRHGRWLGWGPARHGVGGNIAAYVRIPEEHCFVELYCDMEILAADHEPRKWPDDRFSSNTWGPLPPRSYFRFDAAAVASERESREMQGIPLPPEDGAR